MQQLSSSNDPKGRRFILKDKNAPTNNIQVRKPSLKGQEEPFNPSLVAALRQSESHLQQRPNSQSGNRNLQSAGSVHSDKEEFEKKGRTHQENAEQLRNKKLALLQKAYTPEVYLAQKQFESSRVYNRDELNEKMERVMGNLNEVQGQTGKYRAVQGGGQNQAEKSWKGEEFVNDHKVLITFWR